MRPPALACHALVALVFAFGSDHAAAQAAAQPEPLPAFNTARTPTSPAFTLLGVEPAAVERPSNPADLAMAFGSHVSELSTVPEDFALEVSPFWLVGRPTLTWQSDQTRGLWQSFVRTASLSIATGEIGTKSASVRGLSVGGRTSLVSGQLSEESRAAITRLEGLLAAEAAVGARLMAAQLQELNRMLIEKTITVEEHQRRMAELERATSQSKEYRDSAEARAVQKLMQQFASVRNGWFVELAGAAGWHFPDAIWAAGDFGRWGLWLTPSFIGRTASLVGVLRYLSDDTVEPGKAGVFDAGIRAIHFQDRYALSVEYLKRSYDAQTTGGHRLVGIAEYAVREDMWVVATFGRNHDSLREGSFLARLGLSFSFNNDRYVSSLGGP